MNLHAADIAISRLVFHSTLPASFEWVLSPLWIWHGCPLTALALGPWVIVVAQQIDHGDGAQGDALIFVLLAGIGCALAARWFWLLASGNPDGIYMRYIFMPPIVAATALSAMWVDHIWGGERLAATSFYYCSWLLTQAFVIVCKPLFGRQRPGVAIAPELDHVPRALPSLTYLRVTGHTANESFPSGDAAGATAFSASLVFAGGVQTTMAVFVAVCTVHGRMYIWAHHLGDVVAGCLIGAASTISLEVAIGAVHFGLLHLAVTSALIGVALCLRKLMHLEKQRDHSVVAGSRD